jgi:dihydroorotate dehydrogenase (fumarate)
MNLSTTYLGCELSSPLLVGAGPIGANLDLARRAEDAGAGGLVMNSLFEEQITREQFGTIMDMELHSESFAEALSYFPSPDSFRLGPENYLDQIRRLKASLAIPVIASLNGITPSGWIDYARLMAEAGADALELNVYYPATNPMESGEAVEARALDIIRAVKGTVKIPVAVKLSPYFSSMAHFAGQAEGAGADALVLFNRFYQPDIDIENLEVDSGLELSSPWTLRLRLRWLAVLYGQLRIPLSASGGVHTAQDALKALMAGATTVQLVSALLRHGPEHLRTVKEGMVAWMEEHEYESLAQLRGSMSLQKSPNPQAFERANYMRVLTGWKG